jgi:hypothetical protein
MSLYIDKKFVSLVSPKLERFTQKSEYLWNCRCKLCGDSSKNKFRARGYFYRRKSDLFYTCHNCGVSISLGNFLKAVDPSLYREYQMEKYKNEPITNVKQPDFSLAKVKPVFKTKDINLPTIASLPAEHAAKKYILSRKLPPEFLSSIYFTDNFGAFVKELLPDYEKTLYKESRIIIPFYDEEKKLLGFQGRALGESKVKYITIKMDDDYRKIYGLDRLDFSKRIYVCEGPFNSMFLKNGIATMDATLYNVIPTLGDHDYVFIYDNDPRNRDIIKHMRKTIDLNKNIFIWPKNVTGEDINDNIMNGMTGAEIQSIIDRNTFCDLRAKLELEQWRKV